MIKKAQKNYPDLNFKLANITNTMEFPENTFTHIICLYFTIYYIKDKKQFLENCYHWLKPQGILVIHLVNVSKFNPIVPSATSFNNDSNRPTKSEITFDEFTYNSDFKQNKSINSNTCNLKEPNVIFKEVFKFNDKSKTRVNEHKLYMSSQQSIISTAKEIGFNLKSYTEMKDVDTYDYNYIYILQKLS